MFAVCSLSQHVSRAGVSDYIKNASTVLNQKDLTLALPALYKGLYERHY